MAQSRQTVIAGAGIAGLAAALALCRMDHKPLVLERAAAPYELGAGLQLSPNAVRVLEQLGLAAELAEVSLCPDALVLRNAHSANELARMALGIRAKI